DFGRAKSVTGRLSFGGSDAPAADRKLFTGVQPVGNGVTMRSSFCVATVLLVIGASSPQKAETHESDVRSRDLSAMFYTDTLPVNKRAENRKPRPESKRPAQEHDALERRIGLKSRVLLRDSTCNIQEAPAS